MRSDSLFEEFESLRTLSSVWVFSYHATICMSFWFDTQTAAKFHSTNYWFSRIGEAGHFATDIFFALCKKNEMLLFDRRLSSIVVHFFHQLVSFWL
jgi:hypothetical protein